MAEKNRANGHNHRNGQGPADNDVPPSILNDDEGRIDWARKQKGKKRRQDVDLVADTDEKELDLVEQSARSRKRTARKKRRELVYDEHRERVVVRRKRKRQRHDPYDEWYGDSY